MPHLRPAVHDIRLREPDFEPVRGEVDRIGLTLHEESYDLVSLGLLDT
ncbi:hypothetical protein [Lentzea sp. CA-135723]